MATMIKELNQGYYIISLGRKQLRSINNVFSNYRSIYLKIYATEDVEHTPPQEMKIIIYF